MKSDKLRNALLKIFCLLIQRNKVRYQLEAVDVPANILLIRCCGKRTIIKTSFELAISDSELIDGLSAIEATIIGGYYGRALKTTIEKSEALRKAKSMSFLLKDKAGQYRIVYEHRSGEIGYINKRNKQEFIEHPLIIVKNQYVISKFDPSQACYIGILAGIRIEKSLDWDKKTGQHQLKSLLKKPPKLRIVE